MFISIKRYIAQWLCSAVVKFTFCHSKIENNITFLNLEVIRGRIAWRWLDFMIAVVVALVKHTCNCGGK